MRSNPHSSMEAMEMEAEAERRRRAEVLQSEGDRQSEVNLAQGPEKPGRFLDGYGSIPMENTIFRGLFTSINPSYDLM